MNINIILEIIGVVCIFTGGVFYLIHTNKEEDEKFGVISIILAAIGIGLFIGATNISSGNHSVPEYYEIPEDNGFEDINEEDNIDPNEENIIDP